MLVMLLPQFPRCNVKEIMIPVVLTGPIRDEWGHTDFEHLVHCKCAILQLFCLFTYILVDSKRKGRER